MKRSVLAMPGSNARALEKGKTLGADALMFELEDGVAENAKATARDQIVAALESGGYGERQIVVRVNARGSAWYRDDLAALAKAPPDAIVIPKVNGREDVLLVASDLIAAGVAPSVRLWAMIETPRAILDVEKIAGAVDSAPRLETLMLGPNDIAKSTRVRLTKGRPGLIAWLSAAVLAARVHGLDIVDGIYNDFNDEAGLRAEAEQGRDLGKILAAFDQPENEDKGVVQIDGRMVERLHLDEARRALALVGAAP
jgi:citrate lyase subunit beta/citryl-CoA lyase